RPHQRPPVGRTPGRYSSSTATHSPIAPTTHSRRQSGARTAGGAGAIVGFANFLLRLYEAEQPRAVIVGWDTLEVPTERHEKFPAYQSGREFDDELLVGGVSLRER